MIIKVKTIVISWIISIRFMENKVMMNNFFFMFISIFNFYMFFVFFCILRDIFILFFIDIYEFLF